MINLYVDSNMDTEGKEALMRWSHEKEVAMFFADLNEDAKDTIHKFNLDSLPVLVDIGHNEGETEVSCTKLSVGVNAILAYSL